MKRKLIEIDEQKCNGCGLCASACHEGAIAMVDGKAKLVRDDYCDGLGNCLPACPTNAIAFVEREAVAFDAAGVANHLKKGGFEVKGKSKKPSPKGGHSECVDTYLVGQQWPLQIQLVASNANFLHKCDLVIAADCTAFACADFGKAFMKGKITLIACPKLDEYDYVTKLAEIFEQNQIKSITIVRMSVPCCGGIVHYVQEALKKSGNDIFCSTVIVDTQGVIVPQVPTQGVPQCCPD
ncbi:MAG: 4Fe-4S binding protein [Firmicutes bacterium]|nr:4Fe-4S binding protein [Bacillota bacterium]